MQSITLSEPKVNKFGEIYFEEINGQSFEKLSSDVVFNRYYQEILESDEHLFIVVGTDSGLLYKFINEHELSNKVKVIFIDFDAVNQTLLPMDQKEDWQGNVRLVNQDFEFNRIADDYWSYLASHRITLLKSMAVYDAKPGSQYFKLWEQCSAEYRTFISSQNSSLNRKTFEDEGIFNAADFVKSIGNLKDCFQGADVIVLGGGPTLDDAIDWLRENQHRIIIVAAARIANRLAAESITPDFFITVDPYPWSFDNSKGILPFADETILLFNYHAQHKLVSQWTGLSAYMGPRSPWSSIDELNITVMGPTVTNSALQITCLLGANRIFLSGVDLCFARGVSHESGSDEVKVSDKISYFNTVLLEDNEGNMSESPPDLYSAFTTMELVIDAFKSTTNIEIYSLGLHSAKLKGVPYIACNDVVLNDFKKFDVMFSVREKLAISIEERKDLSKVRLIDLQKQLKCLQDIKRLSSEGVRAARKLHEEQFKQPTAKAINRLQKLKKKAESLVGDQIEWLMSYQAMYFADFMRSVSEESSRDRKDVFKSFFAYFDGLVKVSSELIPIFNKGIDRAKLRVDELNPKVKPSMLFSRWEEYQEFGRAKQWAQWHNQDLSVSEQATLDLALRHYQTEYEKEDHAHLDILIEDINDIAKLYPRAKQAYQKLDQQSLEEIIEHTQSSEELGVDSEEQQKAFVNLLKGMRAEVLKQTESALEYYLMVDEPVFRAQALNYALQINMTLNNYAESLFILEQLCVLSLDYMVPYAEMLSANGSKESAAQVLEMYLTQHPEKIEVKNKLAQLMIELKQNEQASLLLDSILKEQPSNKTALFLKAQLK